MSYSSRYGSGSDSRRHSSSSSRRDSSPPRHRSRRSPSPGPSRGRSSPKRDPKNLPESFGRIADSSRVDDEMTVLQRMKSSYENSPLAELSRCIREKKKAKIWTRNFKEVRGVMTGYILAFDKHWNLVLSDVDEVYLKPKKSKTPFLREIAANESLPDIPAKVPKEKKKAPEDAQPAPPPPPPAPKEKEGGDEEEKKKKKRRKKAKSTSAKRQVNQLFIRGDNIVMICPLEENPAMEEEEEEEVEEEEQARNSG